ncbi:hypothetical protein KP509_1Z033600 [Ceratopteris richardii]|nr:hypothetical protein KP509_1Z033400 [Ceratopteris richardii]KAH6558987.1 hypothetical protein KP509_1Z033600 [Ceratopteris richardii]
MAHRPPRDVQIRPPGSQKEKIDIARIIAKWDLDIMDRGWGQTTLLQFPREIPGWRIDNQENGAFELNGLQYYSIAVQRGSNVYSSVLVPVGYNLGRTRIRNAMLRSRDEGFGYLPHHLLTDINLLRKTIQELPNSGCSLFPGLFLQDLPSSVYEMLHRSWHLVT